MKLFARSLSGSLRWKAVRSVSIEKRYLCVAIRQSRLKEKLPLAISHKLTPKINLTIIDAEISLITSKVYCIQPCLLKDAKLHSFVLRKIHFILTLFNFFSTVPSYITGTGQGVLQSPPWPGSPTRDLQGRSDCRFTAMERCEE